MGQKGPIREANARMAARMKEEPNKYPDSARKPWRGAGVGDRDLAKKMGRVSNNTTGFDRGMLGGYLCAKLGLGSYAGFEA